MGVDVGLALALVLAAESRVSAENWVPITPSNKNKKGHFHKYLFLWIIFSKKVSKSRTRS